VSGKHVPYGDARGAGRATAHQRQGRQTERARARAILKKLVLLLHRIDDAASGIAMRRRRDSPPIGDRSANAVPPPARRRTVVAVRAGDA
jgi:hypothetical protein